MRLIDADVENERLLDFIAQNCDSIQYAIEHKNREMLSDVFFFYFEEQRTAFDLESAIEQIKEEERRLLVEMELFGKTQGASRELVFIKYNQALLELVKVRENLKSTIKEKGDIK